MKLETFLLSFLLLCALGDAACGGGGSPASQPPPIEPNPAPTVIQIFPETIAAGGAAFTLRINGKNFIAASTVNFGGAAPATTFVNPTLLTALIPAASIASTGTPAVTVTNPAPGGGTSAITNFTITGDPVPAITYLYPACAPAGSVDSFVGGLMVGGANFFAGSVVRWNGSDLPTTLDPGTGAMQLTAQISASDFAAAGTAAVTVFSPAPGGGTSNSLPFTITSGATYPQSIVVDPAGKFAYVASSGCGYQGYVSMYTINPTTGALTSIGPPVSTRDISTDSVTVDPLGKFAYVASSGDFCDYGYDSPGSISTYTINPTTGALTFSGAIIGVNPGSYCFNSLAVDPSGKFAFATKAGENLGGDSLAMYTINATTGALTSIGTIAAGPVPNAVAVDPSGKFAFVVNESADSAGNVSTYALNATTGALTSTGMIATGSDPVSVAVDPSGKFAYVANNGSNDVSMYTIDATTGALTSIGTIAAGTNPVSVAVESTGKFAYVANNGSNNVSTYTINATTGALTSTGTIAAGQFPTSIAAHPSGKFAYVTNYSSNTVSMYSIDATTGALTLIGTVGS
jgi:YVTN family beta-propeller protein